MNPARSLQIIALIALALLSCCHSVLGEVSVHHELLTAETLGKIVEIQWTGSSPEYRFIGDGEEYNTYPLEIFDHSKQEWEFHSHITHLYHKEWTTFTVEHRHVYLPYQPGSYFKVR